jgi:hypothetical protein
MNKDSIAEKIAELFEFYQSDVISKSEYDLLKKQLLTNVKEHDSKPEEKELSAIKQSLNGISSFQTIIESDTLLPSNEVKTKLSVNATDVSVGHLKNNLSDFENVKSTQGILDPSNQNSDFKEPNSAKTHHAKRFIVLTVFALTIIVLIAILVYTIIYSPKDTQNVAWKQSVLKELTAKYQIPAETSALRTLNNFYAGLNSNTFNAYEYFASDVERYTTLITTNPSSINDYISSKFKESHIGYKFIPDFQKENFQKQNDGKYLLEFEELGLWFQPSDSLFHTVVSKIRVMFDNSYKIEYFDKYQELSHDKVKKQGNPNPITNTNESNENSIIAKEFDNDNISLDNALKLREQFLRGENQIAYNAYNDHKYSLNLNAPMVDSKRGVEPKSIVNGYQRAYYPNSENVCKQRKIMSGSIVEEITFHPNGKIYSVITIRNTKLDGKVKLVDLENYVILEGSYNNGQLIGYWNTPVLGHLDVTNREIANQYPGVFNQIKMLVHFYDMDSDTRTFYSN